MYLVRFHDKTRVYRVINRSTGAVHSAWRGYNEAMQVAQDLTSMSHFVRV